jgi:hypothetical protein
MLAHVSGGQSVYLSCDARTFDTGEKCTPTPIRGQFPIPGARNTYKVFCILTASKVNHVLVGH